jgi:hypothetical protein
MKHDGIARLVAPPISVVRVLIREPRQITVPSSVIGNSTAATFEKHLRMHITPNVTIASAMIALAIVTAATTASRIAVDGI